MLTHNIGRYRSDIDGLRAVAIILVVLYHSGVDFISGGFIGVDVFFVISGFLIGGIINKEIASRKFTYSNFYVRRIKRIAPALIVMILLCSVFSYFYLSPDELYEFSKYSAATLLSIPNIALWKGIDYFSINSELNPMLMTWSLGVEEQFYIFLPLLFSFCVSKRIKLSRATLVITIISFFLCVYLTKIKPLPAFYLLPTRAWEMGVGVLLSLNYNKLSNFVVVKNNKSMFFMLGMLLILASAIKFNHGIDFPGHMAALPVIGAALIILGESRVSNIFLSNKLMVYIGLVSYSWYLWHWPLLSFARLSYNGDMPTIIALQVSFLALIVSYFSYKFVEVPFRKKSNVQNKHVIYSYLSVTLVFLLPLSLAMYTGGFKYRVNESIIDSENTRVVSISNRCIVANSKELPNFPECMPKAKNDSIALIGDSHAAALRGGVDAYAKDKGLSVYQLTKSSCPALGNTTRYIKTSPEHSRLCYEFNKNVLKEIIENKNIKLVVMSAYWDAGINLINESYGYKEYGKVGGNSNISSLKNGLTEVVKKIRGSGKDVVIVMDVPFLKFDAVKEVVNKNIPLRRVVRNALGRVSEPDEFSKRVVDEMEDVKSVIYSMRDLGVRVISPQENLCNKNGCQHSKDGVSIYYDQQHLNKIGGIIALSNLL